MVHLAEIKLAKGLKSSGFKKYADFTELSRRKNAIKLYNFIKAYIIGCFDGFIKYSIL